VLALIYTCAVVPNVQVSYQVAAASLHAEQSLDDMVLESMPVQVI